MFDTSCNIPEAARHDGSTLGPNLGDVGDALRRPNPWSPTSALQGSYAFVVNGLTKWLLLVGSQEATAIGLADSRLAVQDLTPRSAAPNKLWLNSLALN